MKIKQITGWILSSIKRITGWIVSSIKQIIGWTVSSNKQLAIPKYIWANVVVIIIIYLNFKVHTWLYYSTIVPIIDLELWGEIMEWEKANSFIFNLPIPPFSSIWGCIKIIILNIMSILIWYQGFNTLFLAFLLLGGLKLRLIREHRRMVKYLRKQIINIFAMYPVERPGLFPHPNDYEILEILGLKKTFAGPKKLKTDPFTIYPDSEDNKYYTWQIMVLYTFFGLAKDDLNIVIHELLRGRSTNPIIRGINENMEISIEYRNEVLSMILQEMFKFYLTSLYEVVLQYVYIVAINCICTSLLLLISILLNWIL